MTNDQLHAFELADNPEFLDHVEQLTARIEAGDVEEGLSAEDLATYLDEEAPDGS